MGGRYSTWVKRWALALVALLACAAPAQAQAQAQTVASVPWLAHVALVVMENRAESQIIGSDAAPYVNSLARAGAYLDSYTAVAHPSLPNYLALAGGDTFGITSDCTSCFVNARNLSDLLADAGISGKAYMEGMPRACFPGSQGRYAQKHNPFAYFDDVRNDPSRCRAVVPYSQLASDLASGSLPAFTWITPDLCHDMHDCDVGTGDRWLASNLPPLLGSEAFRQQPSMLVIVWDEDDGSAANRVPLILTGSSVQQGYVSHTPANHYSLLRTIEAAWGLPPLTANDAAAQPITDVFAN
jgi:phosphatidylinositol-3-phosphatase